MMGTIIAMLLVCSYLIGITPAAHAEVTTVPLGFSIYGLKSNVEAHIVFAEIDDARKGSTQTSTPLERVKWFRLFYNYENHGDSTADGDLKLLFYDEQGNEYKLDDRTYTGDTISPHSISTLKFVELPIPKDSNIVKLRVIKGFDHTDFTVPLPGTVTPTATAAPTAVPTSTATATPVPSASSGGSGSCLPLLPFAILATLGLTGVLAGRKVAKK
jgi:hypothetical protein